MTPFPMTAMTLLEFAENCVVWRDGPALAAARSLFSIARVPRAETVRPVPAIIWSACADPMTLSEQLYLLFEGAITASQFHGEPWPAEYARRAAEKLLAGSSIEPRPSAKRNKVFGETQVEGSGRLGTGKR